MRNDLPISPKKKFKYSITFESWDEESLEAGQSDVRGYEVEDDTDLIGDILYKANTTYGIYMPVSFGTWESTEPNEDRDFWEKGIRKYYALHITNEDGTEISQEESDFISFLLSDGHYEINKFRDYAVGGIVLGSIALGVGALITYFYFKGKKGKKSLENNRAKSVTHIINGKERTFPIKDAWRKDHNTENKSQKFEVPQADRYEMGGDASQHYHEIEYGEGGVARAKEVIMKKIGYDEKTADYFVSKSEKFAIWLADSILKEELREKGYTKEKYLNSNVSSWGNINWQYSDSIRLILDWLQHPVTPKQDLKKLSFAQAKEFAKEWHNDLQVLGGDIDFTEPEKNTILKKYPVNADGIEYYWVFIPSNYCDLESSRMGHCGRTGYGNNLISLRSVKPYGKGHTINDSHITIAYGMNDGIFYQIKGKKNNKPAEKYFPYIFDLVKSAIKDNDIEYSKTSNKFDENNKLMRSKSLLEFNGFGSEYGDEEDYGFDDMKKEELRELYQLKPTIFNDADSILAVYDAGVITNEELQTQYDVNSPNSIFSSFGNQMKLYERGIILNPPSTIFQLDISCDRISRYLDLGRDINDDLVEDVLCGVIDDYYDNWSYYYDNWSDLLGNLNNENEEKIIEEIVRITGLSKTEVKENGINYYLNGDDENFSQEEFTQIFRVLANAQNNADTSDYHNYLYSNIKSALEELGEVESLNDEGAKITIDLSNLLSEEDISGQMDYYEFTDIADLFEEEISMGHIDLPKLIIDDRYTPYGSSKDFNDYISDSDIESFAKGGSLRPKSTTSKKTKIKNMKPSQRKLAQGGSIGTTGISKEDYFLVVKNWVYFTFNYPMGFVKDAFDSKHLEEKFSSSYERYGSIGVLMSFWANLDGNNRRILALWIKNNYFNSASEKTKLQSISDDNYAQIITHWNMFCFNFPYEFIQNVFGDNTSHFEMKWVRAYESAGSTGAVNKFFTEMSSNNQMLLTDWVYDNYKGMNFADGGLIDESYFKKYSNKYDFYTDDQDNVIRITSNDKELLDKIQKDYWNRIAHREYDEYIEVFKSLVEKKGKIELSDGAEGRKIAKRIIVEKDDAGDVVTYDLEVGLFSDRKKGYFIVEGTWDEVMEAGTEDEYTEERYFYQEGGLWIQGGKVYDYDGVYALEPKLKPLMSALNLNSSEVFADGGDVGSKIPYIIWVSKDGRKREYYGEYKSMKSAEMMAKKLIQSGDYESVGTKSKSNYEKTNSLFDNGGEAQNKIVTNKNKNTMKYANGGNAGDWSVTDVSNANYLGVIEFEDNEGEFHNFEVMETDDRLVFGGMTNSGFIESGYIEKDGFSTDETLQSLLEDLEVYYNDGGEYTSQIVFNERMAKGGELKYKFPNGSVVWDKTNKTYGVVLNNFGNESEGGRGDLRLDSDGIQSIFHYDKKFNQTQEYNLVPFGSKEDKGNGDLKGLKESAKSIIELAKPTKNKEHIAFYTDIYSDLLSGKFDKKFADGGEAIKDNKGEELSLGDLVKYQGRTYFIGFDGLPYIIEVETPVKFESRTNYYKPSIKEPIKKIYFKDVPQIQGKIELIAKYNDVRIYAGGGVNLLSDKFTEVGYNTYARNFGVALIDGFNDEKDINILVSAIIEDMYDATGDEQFEDKPFVLILETHAYPEFWSDEYAENIKDMVDDYSINPRNINYLSDAHTYGLGVPLSTLADDVRFKTEEEAIKFLNSKKLNEQISGLGFLSGFHFDKQINRIGDTGWKYLSEQVGANYEEYEEGGSADLEYSDILNVLKSKIDDSIEEIPMKYENSNDFTGEEVEHESRDGFIPFTDGGYEAVWFEQIGNMYGTGNNLPNKVLDDEMNRQINYNLEMAKESFIEKYPELVEEIGVENIDYHSLNEAGYSDEAEELSEMESENLYDEGSIMMQITAYYYSPENDRGIEDKHTIRLFGDVNLESPYHRQGNLDDSYDIDFTFDSIAELEEKMDAGLKEIISWFDGDMYNDSTSEMKVRRMAKGGKVKTIKKRVSSIKIRAEKLLEESITYVWTTNDMGSGWKFMLENPNGGVLDTSLVLDIFDGDEYVSEYDDVEDWNSLSKADKKYYFDQYKEELLQVNYDYFKDEMVLNYLDEFIEYLQRDSDDNFAEGGETRDEAINKKLGIPNWDGAGVDGWYKDLTEVYANESKKFLNKLKKKKNVDYDDVVELSNLIGQDLTDGGNDFIDEDNLEWSDDSAFQVCYAVAEKWLQASKIKFEYAEGGSTDEDDDSGEIQEQLDELVQDFSSDEYKAFCYEHDIDREDAQEMSDFIYSQTNNRCKEIIQEIEDGYYTGGHYEEDDDEDEYESGGRITKYVAVYMVQGNYGQGWEDLTAHDTYKEAKAEKIDYDKNERNYPHRVITRRVLRSDYEKGNYAEGGETGELKNVSGNAFYITDTSVENADKDFDSLSDTHFSSKEDFENNFDAIKEFYFNVNVANQWNIIPAIYEKIAEEGVGNDEGNLQILGFEVNSYPKNDFESELPYDIEDEDEDENYDEDEDDDAEDLKKYKGKVRPIYFGDFVDYTKGKWWKVSEKDGIMGIESFGISDDNNVFIPISEIDFSLLTDSKNNKVEIIDTKEIIESFLTSEKELKKGSLEVYKVYKTDIVKLSDKNFKIAERVKNYVQVENDFETNERIFDVASIVKRIRTISSKKGIIVSNTIANNDSDLMGIAKYMENAIKNNIDSYSLINNFESRNGFRKKLYQLINISDRQKRTDAYNEMIKVNSYDEIYNLLYKIVEANSDKQRLVNQIIGVQKSLKDLQESKWDNKERIINSTNLLKEYLKKFGVKYTQSPKTSDFDKLNIWERIELSRLISRLGFGYMPFAEGGNLGEFNEAIVTDLYDKINGKKIRTQNQKSIKEAIESANENSKYYKGYAEVYIGAIFVGFSKNGNFKYSARYKGDKFEEGGEAGGKYKYGIFTVSEELEELGNTFYSDNPDLEFDPFGDDVPFSVGSNQIVRRIDEYAEGGEVEDWMEEALASLIEETGYDDLEITIVSNDGNEFYATDENAEYRVFKTEDNAEETAIQQVREDLEENPDYFNQDWLMNYIDGDFFEVTLNDMNDSYVQDIESESDSKYANRLIAELVENGLMDEEDAESDNAEELAIDLKYDYVDLLTREKLEEGNDGLDYFINNFGEQETFKMVLDNKLIDIEEASQDAVQTDGIAHFLSSYDGETLYLSDDCVAYRIN
jgi:hypothetical protein